MDREQKVILETIEYFRSYIFEGFTHEITELLQRTFTDKNDKEISDLMDRWWDSVVFRFIDDDGLAKEGKIVEPDDLDDIKKVNKILIEDVWDSQNDWIEDCEDMKDWFFDMDWGRGQYSQDLSFENDDERAMDIQESIEHILDPTYRYIKVSEDEPY